MQLEDVGHKWHVLGDYILPWPFLYCFLSLLLHHDVKVLLQHTFPLKHATLSASLPSSCSLSRWAQRMRGIKHKSQAGSVPWYLITHHIWPFCQTGLQNYSKKCKHFHQCDSYHSTKSEESCWWRDQIKEMKGVHSGVQSAKGSPQEKHMKKMLVVL